MLPFPCGLSEENITASGGYRLLGDWARLPALPRGAGRARGGGLRSQGIDFLACEMRVGRSTQPEFEIVESPYRIWCEITVRCSARRLQGVLDSSRAIFRPSPAPGTSGLCESERGPLSSLTLHLPHVTR